MIYLLNYIPVLHVALPDWLNVALTVNAAFGFIISLCMTGLHELSPLSEDPPADPEVLVRRDQASDRWFDWNMANLFIGLPAFVLTVMYYSHLQMPKIVHD